MNRTMRRYGPTLADGLLGQACGLGALLVGVPLLASIAFGIGGRGTAGALLGAGGVLAFAALFLAAAGVRQNGALVDIGAVLALLSGCGWVVCFCLHPSGWAAAFALLLVGLGLLLLWLYGATLRVRYHPRFLTARQLGSMIQIADAVIEGDGREAISPIQVAVNVDHLLAQMNSPVTKDLRLLLLLVEYALPLVMLGRPLPFGALGSHERRRAIEKTIGRKGMFRKMARALKLLSMMGYYGDARAAASTGYIPFEARVLDEEQKQQAPLRHPEPV
jgi:hypothetical protein